MKPFSKIDHPQENLILSAEAKLTMSAAFAQACIELHDSLDVEGKQKFLSGRAKRLSVDEAALSDAIAVGKEKLAPLFLKLGDENLAQFNFDKDGLAVIKPADLSEASIQEYCDNIDFRGVIAVDDGKGNQTKVSNYHKGMQADPSDHSFATHSVSKLIGGVVMCKMIADGIIPRDALDKKLELSDEVKEKLPPEIKAHLETESVTLRDVMTHKSRLGGYLDPELTPEQLGYKKGKLGYGINGYSGYVRQQLEKGEEVEVPKSPQDYLEPV